MQVQLSPGKYIVAVSGGVDSVVLLDMLRQLPKVELVVAHVNHGIRADGDQDAELVQRLAEKYQLPFESTSLNLGTNAAEAAARERRYAWLEKIRQQYAADAIVTAHHQDDVVETMIINLTRGTGWRGLASLRETKQIRRPLLSISKIEIVTYAIDHALSWREDSTNDDVRYLRNYIRHGIVPRLNPEMVQQLADLYQDQCRLRDEIETEAARIIPNIGEGNGLPRYWLIMVSDAVAFELLRQKYGSLTREHLVRLLHFARTARPGSLLELGVGRIFRVTARQMIALEA